MPSGPFARKSPGRPSGKRTSHQGNLLTPEIPTVQGPGETAARQPSEALETLLAKLPDCDDRRAFETLTLFLTHGLIFALALFAVVPLATGDGSAAAAATDGADLAGVTLRIGDQKGGARALLEAADQLRDLPYKIEWSEFAAAAPLLEALNAGAIDAGGVGDAPLIFAQAAGVPVKAIAAARATPEGTAILVRGDSPFKSVADLRGHRVATGKGSIGHYLVLAALERAGIAPAEVDIVFLTPADAKAALISGSIDAWSTWEPYTSLAELSNGARILVSGKGISAGLGYVVAGDAAIKAKHAALYDYVRRGAAARRWSLAHLGDYARKLSEIIGVPEAVTQRYLNRAQIVPVMIDDSVVADQQRSIDLYAKYGIIPRRIDAGPGFDRSFNAAALVAERALPRKAD
jgi:sulfonate transport system substrate-binding protein